MEKNTDDWINEKITVFVHIHKWIASPFIRKNVVFFGYLFWNHAYKHSIWIKYDFFYTILWFCSFRLCKMVNPLGALIIPCVYIQNECYTLFAFKQISSTKSIHVYMPWTAKTKKKYWLKLRWFELLTLRLGIHVTDWKHKMLSLIFMDLSILYLFHLVFIFLLDTFQQMTSLSRSLSHSFNLFLGCFFFVSWSMKKENGLWFT